MRKLLLIVILVFIFKIADNMKYTPDAIYNIEEINVIVNKWDLLIKDILFIESSNCINLVGDNGNAIGPLQIWKVVVDDVNRIIGEDTYSYEDRWSKQKSIEMFNIYQDYWNPEHDIELAYRLWGKGPTALNRSNDYLTDWYVDKSKLLNRLEL